MKGGRLGVGRVLINKTQGNWFKFKLIKIILLCQTIQRLKNIEPLKKGSRDIICLNFI